MIPSADTTAPDVWRLYDGPRAVGYGKRFGTAMMWSRTGAAYSGKEIDHAIQLGALPLRTLSGAPIFHGDVVSPPGEDADRYLVLGDGEELYFAREGSPRLIPRDRSDFAQRRDFVRLGNVLETVYFSRIFDGALRTFAAGAFPSGTLAWALSLLVFSGCAAAGMVQWMLRAGVGPLSSCVGGVAMGWLFFFAWKGLAPGSFRRSTTRRVADGAVWRTALLFTAAYGTAALLGLPGVGASPVEIVVGMIVAAGLGGGLAMVAGVLAADSLTRHQDGKDGLSSELRSFLDHPGPLLRLRRGGLEPEALDAEERRA